jgi:hypothetical protein
MGAGIRGYGTRCEESWAWEAIEWMYVVIVWYCRVECVMEGGKQVSCQAGRQMIFVSLHAASTKSPESRLAVPKLPSNPPQGPLAD